MKKAHQLDVIDCAITNSAGITVSTDVSAKLGRNGSQELVVAHTRHTNGRAWLRKKKKSSN